MKACPVCGAKAFDDARTCFGCLHPFAEEPIIDKVCEPIFQVGKHAARRLELPTLVISVDAVREEDGDLEWRYSIDQVKPRISSL